MSELEVMYRPVGALRPYETNPRTHTAAQVKQIIRSIEEFGWTNPILVDGDAGVIAGHGRLLAAVEMGMEEVPVIELADLTPEQRQAYVIADNQLTLNGAWDEQLLAAEVAFLDEAGFDTSVLGITDDDLARLLGNEGEGLTDPDEVPETPEDPVTQVGDVWLLGEQWRLC